MIPIPLGRQIDMLMEKYHRPNISDSGQTVMWLDLKNLRDNLNRIRTEIEESSFVGKNHGDGRIIRLKEVLDSL